MHPLFPSRSARDLRRSRVAAIAIATATLSVVSVAGAHADPPEGERRDGIVVTATKTEHGESDAPVPTQVVTREEIETIATDNVEEVLGRIPDLYIRRNEEFGLGATTVRMQGLDANKAAILIDGRRFRGGIDGVVDLRDISAQAIDQIEIVRGPASSLYGSDAMAGVVNIRTRGGSDQPWLRAEGALGTRGRERYAGSHGYRVGPLRYFLSAQHDAVAIADLYGASVSSQYSGANADDLQERNGFRGRLDAEAGANHLRLAGDYQVERNPLSISDDLGLDAGWGRSAGGWNLEADGGLYRYTRSNDLAGFAEEVDYLDASGEARASRTLANLLGADHLVVLGLRTRREGMASAPPGFADVGVAPIDEAAVHASPFVQSETLIGADWSLVLGTSIDYHELYGFDASPRATVTWRPREDFRWSATLGRGYRAPDLRQLFDVDVNNVVVIGDRVTGYAIVGNPDLEPETDLAATTFAEYTGWRGVTVAADAFRHDLEDGIGFEIVCFSKGNCRPGFESPVPDLEGPVFSYRNVAAATTLGVNLSVLLRPFQWLARPPLAHRVEVGVAGGYLRTENLGRVATERGKRLPFRPTFRVLPSLTYSYLPSGTSLRLWVEATGEQYTDLANTEDGKIGSYTTLGARLTQNLGEIAARFGARPNDWMRGLELYGQAENLTGEAITGGFGPTGPMAMVPRRNVQFGVRWTLGGDDRGDGGELLP